MGSEITLGALGLRRRRFEAKAAEAAEDKLVEAKRCGCPSVIENLGKYLASMIYGLGSMVFGRVFIEPIKEKKVENLGLTEKEVLESVLLESRHNSTGSRETSNDVSSQDALSDEGFTALLKRLEQEQIEKKQKKQKQKKHSASSFSSSSSSSASGASSSFSSSSSSASASLASGGQLPTSERRAKIERLYASKTIFRLPKGLKGVKGIQNAGNSCAIASLLFSMFAATNAFDELLLVGPENEAKEVKDIRAQLIKITNILRSKIETSLVKGEDLLKLRNLVMGNVRKGAFLQPDEFLGSLFEKLNIDWQDGNKVTYYSIVEKDDSQVGQIVDQIVTHFSEEIQDLGRTVTMHDLMRREDQIRRRYDIAEKNIQRLLKNEGQKTLEYFEVQFVNYQNQEQNENPDCHSVEEFRDMVIEKCKTLAKNKVKGDNKVLFIQIPRQGYQATRAYDTIIPSLSFSFEGQRYRLQSVVANENENHYVSWVRLLEDRDRNKMYYFNGGGVGTSEVNPKKGLEGLLFGAKEDVKGADAKLKKAYQKLIREGAFFIYVRE